MKTRHAARLACLFLPAFLPAFLAACGGGGDSATVDAKPVITSASAGTAVKYSQTLLVTVLGSQLDQGITLSSAGCRNFVRSTTAPNVSSATRAYYTCTVSATGAQVVNILSSSDNSALGSAPFTVEVPQVTLTLSNGAGVEGDIVITLEPARTPVTVDNFLAYVNTGWYDGVIFHRHSPNFVLQGGGYAASVSTAAVPEHKATNAPIALEVGRGLSNLKLTVAMARTGAPDSATSEFFINLSDANTFLDTSGGGYAVFGSVTGGAEVVTAMTAAACTPFPALLPAGDCLPVPNLVITAAVQTR